MRNREQRIESIAFDLVAGHIILDHAGTRVLLDTGSPHSVGPDGQLDLHGTPIPLKRDYMGVTASDLEKFVGTRVDVLLGSDALINFTIVIDVPDLTMTLWPNTITPGKSEVAIWSLMGIPVVEVAIGESRIPMFFDTGARLSYLDRNISRRYPVVGREVDFHPCFGEFETEIRKALVSVGGSEATLRWGELPRTLRRTLMKGGPQGIIGTEFLNTYKVGLSLHRSVINLTRHDA